MKPLKLLSLILMLLPFIAIIGFILYFLSNPNENFLYVQSGEDNMGTKILFKNGRTYKNVINMAKGTHLLSFDINVADQLFYIVNDFLNK